MPSLLKAIGVAVIDNVGDNIIKRDEAMIEALPRIAAQVWSDWAEVVDERERRLELKALTMLEPEELRSRVQDVVREIASERAPTTRQILNTYLSLVPSQIRQALRRPADPTGTTIPSRLVPRNSEQFMLFLPVDIPIFEPGDRPLPGIDWELVELLGVGGFGEVWRAQNPHFECIAPVVLKFYLGKDAHDNQAFLHEAALLNRALPRGYHPGLVELRATYLASDPPCLEYEYIGDGDLTQIIQDYSHKGGLSPRGATLLLLQLANTVGHFHTLDPPIVHRDLKPSNILVKRKPNGKIQLKIIDFGIGGLAASREIEKVRNHSSQGFILNTALHGSHTPLYASPEQIRGNGPDPRDDIHALGVIWYQMISSDLTNGAPTGLDWVSELFDRGLGEEHINLFASCFASRQERRPDNAKILADQIRQVLATLPNPKSKSKPQPGGRKAKSLASRLQFWKAKEQATPNPPPTHVPANPNPNPTAIPGIPGLSLPRRVASWNNPPQPDPKAANPGANPNPKAAAGTSSIPPSLNPAGSPNAGGSIPPMLNPAVAAASAAAGRAGAPPQAPNLENAPVNGSLRKDGQGLVIVGQPTYDDMSMRLLIAALRQQSPSKTKNLCMQLESAIRNGYFSKQMIWNLSKHCYGDPASREIARTICKKLFGVLPIQFINERDLPIPDLDTAERQYDSWRDIVVRHSLGMPPA